MLSPGMAPVDVASQLSQGIGKDAGPQVSDGSTVIVTNSMLLLSDNGSRTRYTPSETLTRAKTKIKMSLSSFITLFGFPFLITYETTACAAISL